MLIAVQDRVLGASPVEMPQTAEALRRQIVGLLRKGSDDGSLREPLHQILNTVKCSEPTAGCVEVLVCKPNFRRDPSLPHFTRDDGAWFDFHVIVREHPRQPLELVSYGFEIRFSELQRETGPRWVRFDLNPPDHRNEARGSRCHLHPSHDDWFIPAPLMAPAEILHLLVWGMRPRNPGALRLTT